MKLSEKQILFIHELANAKKLDVRIDNNSEIAIIDINTKGNNNLFDGMQIICFDECFEVSQYQAGENKDELYIYKETKILAKALQCLFKGNNQKTFKKWS